MVKSWKNVNRKMVNLEKQVQKNVNNYNPLKNLES